MPASIRVAEVLPELWWHPDLKSDTCLQPVLIALQISLLFCFFPVKENIIRVISPSKGAISRFLSQKFNEFKNKKKERKKKDQFLFRGVLQEGDTLIKVVKTACQTSSWYGDFKKKGENCSNSAR